MTDVDFRSGGSSLHGDYEEEVGSCPPLGLPFQSASCPYMHEGLRSEVRDYLNELEVRHPGMKNVLLNSALSVASKLSVSKNPAPYPAPSADIPPPGGSATSAG